MAPRLGHLLVAEDQLKSGVVVILMGSIPDRVLEAVDVYQDDFAEKIVFVRSYMSGYDKLVERGVTIPGNADISKLAVVELGVPEDIIVLLDGNAQSTKDEAIHVREYLRENTDINTIVLVTSKYHSARSKRTFVKVLKKLDREIEVLSRPSKYDDFNPDRWWKKREDAKRVVLEYLKLMHFFAWEQFKQN